ncbi:MAG: hypothetical protein QOF77_225 [Solirubrobacteraceae bacterium]|nr:hypothetical protein [Solirubrobacteraceae bacterium]
MDPTDPAPAADQEVLEALAAMTAARERDVVARALDAARERLGMDAAYLASITPESQRVDQVAGDSLPLGFEAGTALPLSETYCSRMLDGLIPNLVPDVAAEPALRGLAAAERVRAYAGVPVRLADGRLHGTLCCVAGEARSDLGPRELHFMEVLATIVAAEIDRAEDDRATAALRLLGRPLDPLSPA